MHIPIPQGKYIKNIQVNDGEILVDFKEKKKIALVFICLNDQYWPYLSQVIQDCRKNFLPHHEVDYFAWTDYNLENKQKLLATLESQHQAFLSSTAQKKQEAMNVLLSSFAGIVRLYQNFYPAKIQESLTEMAKLGIHYKQENMKFWVESVNPLTDMEVTLFYKVASSIISLSFADMDKALEGVKIIDTAPAQWPVPTLMRYHLFLNEEESLKEYEYIFYMDADMKVVSKVSDEILGEGLTAAPHPGYAIATNLIPPLEPNPESRAYIPRLGYYKEENGKRRFIPFYAAGGFQGGKTAPFIAAMKELKKNIDYDFDRINYTAIWNDETHWNKYLWDYQKNGGPITFLDVSYVYPDSMIEQYYNKIWGRTYEPKIITLTKPFTLSAQGADELKKITNL